MSSRRASVGILLVIAIVVFGEAVGELLARYLLLIGGVLTLSGLLVIWWNMDRDEEIELHEYESCMWGAIGLDGEDVCTPERTVFVEGKRVVERCRACKGEA